ncbi:hypothetical protein PMG11_10230 [Penicillium brasilianum]|uniref:Uncharacterized protein n=1 Tax=Penicillium brasilianum TaxID=104259 RepID=A0A0F7U2Z5_PENBI|nr:hypothetical protein PMG11_10230 [Penicillium brasilianum]
MDLHHLKSPLFLSSSRATSATFPLTHGSSTPRSNDQPTLDEPFAVRNETPTNRHLAEHPSYRRHHGRSHHASPDESLAHARTRSSSKQVELPGFDGLKSHHRHKHSKSRELRLPRPMSHLASSASARGLLSTWSSGRDKERESDDGLLRPITRETTRSRWGSDSTSGMGSGSRRGSLLDAPEQHERLGPIQRQEIQSMEDLEQVKRRRKQGEEYLRSLLSSVGTIATDLTRRLDYTYYNLLEKITALNSTIGLFQELSDSASTLLNDFESETAGLDQEIRKQINDLKGFEPQIRKADALDERMKKGRQRVEELGKRLEAVRQQIDNWEEREAEWQTRTSRRLRIFWGIVSGAFVVLVLALVLRNWPTISSPHADAVPVPTELAKLVNESSPGSTHLPDTWESVLRVSDPENTSGSSWYPSSLADRRQSLEHAQAASTASASSRAEEDDAATGHDPFRLLDEL